MTWGCCKNLGCKFFRLITICSRNYLSSVVIPTIDRASFKPMFVKAFVNFDLVSNLLMTFTDFGKRSVLSRLKTIVMNFELGTKVLVLNEHHDLAAFKLSM